MLESQYTKEIFLSHESVGQADDAVSEIFEMVLGLEVEATAFEPSVEVGGAAEPCGERTGLVSFFGAMGGSLKLWMDNPAAVFVTSAFLGGCPAEEVEEDSINDAVGELCNLIAGSWKNRNESLSNGCFLTPPSVEFGNESQAHRLNIGAQVRRLYRFGEHSLRLTLQCDELATS